MSRTGGRHSLWAPKDPERTLYSAPAPPSLRLGTFLLATEAGQTSIEQKVLKWTWMSCSFSQLWSMSTSVHLETQWETYPPCAPGGKPVNLSLTAEPEMVL